MKFTDAEMAWFDLDQVTVPEHPMPMTVKTVDYKAQTQVSPPVLHGLFTGEDFFGGLGPVEVNYPDYWTLRQRSATHYQRNLFARGIIRRLVTNIIVTGLHLKAIPDESLLGFPPDSLDTWNEDTESRFELWGTEPRTCDAQELKTFGKLQEEIVTEALVGGDCLVTLYGSSRQPKVRIFPGSAVQTPFDAKPRKGNRIEHGVEIDPRGRHVAFYVRQRDGEFKRLPAWGEKSGRKLAWLVYGTDKRVDEVRGMPILALTIQSLQELDKYRSSTQRKALVNSVLAMWVERTEETIPGSMFGEMATGSASGSTEDATAGSEPRRFTIQDYLPGAVVEGLNAGEKMHAHQVNGVTESYGDFLMAIIKSVSWSLEIPPEILILNFDKSFAASKAANNEFEVFLFKNRTWFGHQICAPVYQEWLISECLAGRIRAEGFLESWRFNDSVKYGAWVRSSWSGHVKATVDPVKAMAGIQMMLDAGLITYDQAAREITGEKFSRVVKQQKRERQMLREALGVDLPEPVDPQLYMVPNDDEDRPAKDKTS